MVYDFDELRTVRSGANAQPVTASFNLGAQSRHVNDFGDDIAGVRGSRDQVNAVGHVGDVPQVYDNVGGSVQIQTQQIVHSSPAKPKGDAIMEGSPEAKAVDQNKDAQSSMMTGRNKKYGTKK